MHRHNTRPKHPAARAFVLPLVLLVRSKPPPKPEYKRKCAPRNSLYNQREGVAAVQMHEVPATFNACVKPFQRLCKPEE